ncbi:heme-dependent peroxidase, partial [Bacillus pseudomycoides]|nr:heme-dependent peroxidase [Bacillus pseudomycoides]
MREAAKTLDGWYCLHDLRSIDWAAWKTLSSDERGQAMFEFLNVIEKWNKVASSKQGSHASYTVVGQKADSM